MPSHDCPCPSSAIHLLLYLRDAWEHRDQVLAHPRLRASRTAWFVFTYRPASCARYPTLAELFACWEAGLLHARCPRCGGPALVARVVQTFGGGTWGGICTACPALLEAVPTEDMRLVIEVGLIVPTTLGDPPVVHPVDAHATWARGVSAYDLGISYASMAIGHLSFPMLIEAPDGHRWFYEPVERVLEDAAGHVLAEHDETSVRLPDGTLLARREGPLLVLVEDGRERPWLERIRLDGASVHVEAGVTYLPQRYQEHRGDLLCWKDQPCLRVEGPVPMDLLLLLADGRVPPADPNAPPDWR